MTVPERETDENVVDMGDTGRELEESMNQQDEHDEGLDPLGDEGQGGDRGGEGDPPPPDDGLEEVVVGGRTLRLPHEEAEAVRAEQRRYQEDMARAQQAAQARPAQEYNQPASQPAGYENRGPATQQDDDDLENLLFTDPKKALEIHGQKVEERVSQRLRQEYQAEQATQNFWDEFYRDNPKLKSHDDIVKLVLNQNMNELSAMPVDSAKVELANRASQKILDIAKSTGQSGAATSRARTEGASGQPAPKPKPKAPDDEDKPTSLSEVLRKRREQRRTG